MDRVGSGRIGLDRVGSGWIGLDLVGSGWIGLDRVGSGWIWLDRVGPAFVRVRSCADFGEAAPKRLARRCSDARREGGSGWIGLNQPRCPLADARLVARSADTGAEAGCRDRPAKGETVLAATGSGSIAGR